LRVTIDQVSDQQRDIPNTLAQRRHSNRKDIKAVEKILTERAIGYCRIEVSVCRRYHSYVHRKPDEESRGIISADEECHVLLLWERDTRMEVEAKTYIGHKAECANRGVYD
jgi:hypothetical protein